MRSCCLAGADLKVLARYKHKKFLNEHLLFVISQSESACQGQTLQLFQPGINDDGKKIQNEHLLFDISQSESACQGQTL